jgi:replication factor A1
MKLSELKGQMRRVSVKGRIREISSPRDVLTRFGEARVATAVLTDDSDEIKLSLWNDQIDMVSVGDEVEVENGYVTEFRGEAQLNVGRYGRLKVNK